MDSLGAAAVVQTLEALSAQFGPRFTPAPSLVEMASGGGRFHQD